MIKKFLILLLFLITLINLANAESNFNILKASYNSGETLQAELNLSVNPVNEITQSNFVLTNQNNETIPIPLFLEKTSNKYYFTYFNLPNLEPGIYNFEARDVRYIDEEDSLLKQLYFKKQFNLLNNTLDSTSVSIYPGIILFNQKLTITNNLNPLNITIEAPDYTNLSNTYLLINKIILDIKLYDQAYNIKVDYKDKEYNIPVVSHNEEVISNTTNFTNILEVPSVDSIVFLNSTLGYTFPKEIFIKKDISIYNPFYIKNVWNYSIYNLTFTITGSLAEIVGLDKYTLEELKSNEARKQILIINENKNPSKDYYFGSILVTSPQKTASYLNLNINFIEEQNNLTLNNNITNIGFKPNQTINQTQTNYPEKNNSPIIFIVIFIIIIIALFLIYILFKKKINKEESFEEHFYKFKR